MHVIRPIYCVIYSKEKGVCIMKYLVILLFILLACSGKFAIAKTMEHDNMGYENPMMLLKGSKLSKDSWQYMLDNAMYSIGDKDADVVIAYASAFSCPHCKKLKTEIMPKLAQKYALENRKILLVAHNILGYKHDLSASMLAKCLQDKKGTSNPAFHRFIHVLYENQDLWAFESSAHNSKLRSIALLAGLTEEEHDTCIDNETLSQELISLHNDLIQKVILTTSKKAFTPYIVINGHIYQDVIAYDSITNAIENIKDQ